MFVDFNAVQHKSVFVKFLYLITSLGHQSVVIFFVLSGFLIAGSVINQLKRGAFKFSSYFINRFSRLYAVLFIALLLTLILDHTGIYFDKIGLYSGKIKTATLGFSIADRLSFKYFLTSLLMLQEIVLPPIGSNSPLWSLSYEFWYYILFPCMGLFVLYVINKSIYLVIPFLVFVATTLFLPSIILLYFIIWLIGLIPFYLTLSNKLYKYILPVFFLFWVFSKNLIKMNDFSYDLILGIIIALWVSSYSNFEQPLSTPALRINEKLAAFSYSTYLVHFPLIMLLLTCIKNTMHTGIRSEPGTAGFLIFILVFITVIIYSYLIAVVSEFRTDKFRDFLKRTILRKKEINA